MDALARLVALQEIRDQIARYAILFDDKSWDEFAELWAEDAVWAGPGMEFTGKAELMRFLSTCLPADYIGKHMNSPPLIELTRRGPRPRAHGRRLDHRRTSQPDRRALRRQLPARRRPLAVRAAHRGRRAATGPAAADVGDCAGSQQRDDAPGRGRRERSKRHDHRARLPDRPRSEAGADRRGLRVHRGPGLGSARACLLFSDIPGDARWRWTRSEGMALDHFPTFKGNGMALDNDGHLIVCEQVSSSSCASATARASWSPSTTRART